MSERFLYRRVCYVKLLNVDNRSVG